MSVPLRIAIVTQYFRPEIGATQNRLGAFADGLVERGHDVRVIAEQPNHPSGIFQAGFGRTPVVTQRSAGLVVHRLWVAAAPTKTTARRLAFYGTFALGAGAAMASVPRPDVMLVTSPPLPGALTAGFAAAARGIPFVLDVRDLWPAAAEALGELSHAPSLRALERAERWVYRRAAAVTATTVPFCDHVDERAGVRRSVHLPNGALDELVQRPDPGATPDGPFTLGYVGNFGIAQGLDIVLDAAEHLQGEDIRIRMVGTGPLEQQLMAARERRGLSAIEFRPQVPTAAVGDELVACDALLVPLRAHDALRDFIPSKLYDAMAVGRPIVVAAAGEPERLVAETGCGISVPPEDGPALANALRDLRSDPVSADAMGRAGRAASRGLGRSRMIDRLDALLGQVAANDAGGR